MTDAGGFGPQQKEGELGRDFVSEVKGRIYGVHAHAWLPVSHRFVTLQVR